MAPLEPWEKVLVNNEAFTAAAHGEVACVDCHSGLAQAGSKDEAHTGMDPRPSDGEATVCVECHEEQVAAQATSLHATQQGYWTVLEARGADPHDPAMQEMFGNHCASCHTSCGDCHVSQPDSVGGGLLDGHLFTSDPPMTRTCTACHGSRVGNEYMGKNEGVLADLHFRQQRMVCVDCHSGTELHGATASSDEGPPAHRYEGDLGPRCETCHDNYATSEDEIMMHQMHGETLSCQVCHSTTYVNCESCHVQVSEETGNPYFTTSNTFFTFLIGRNPRKSNQRPYDYVPLRHVPVDPDSFAFYGENLLPEFDNQPTWRYATPHNIQRETPQTETCNHCHGNPDLFLTADKINAQELEANSPVIVEEVPETRN